MKDEHKVLGIGAALVALIFLVKRRPEPEPPVEPEPEPEPEPQTLTLPAVRQTYKTTALFDLGQVLDVIDATVDYKVGWATNYYGLVTIAVSENGTSYTTVKTVDGYGHQYMQTEVSINRSIRYIRVSTTAPPYLDYARVTVRYWE